MKRAPFRGLSDRFLSGYSLVQIQNPLLRVRAGDHNQVRIQNIRVCVESQTALSGCRFGSGSKLQVQFKL